MKKQFRTSRTQTFGFGKAMSFTVGAGPQSVAIADFNGDGKQDLVTANFGGNTVSILLGVGTGSFGASIHFTVGAGPQSVAIADFNGDGKQDLVTANSGNNTVSVLLGTGTGSFGTSIPFSVGNAPRSVAIADFNRDGKQDLVTANSGGNTVSVLLGTGTGSFGTSIPFSVGNAPKSVAIADFNGDGKQDLVAANYGFGDGNTVSILLGTGTGSFDTAMSVTVGRGAIRVVTADFNGDNKQDLVTINAGGSTASILLGTGTGSFITSVHPAAVGTSSLAVAIADFNGDNKQDLATTRIGYNTVSILLGNGDGNFGIASTFSVGSSPQSVAIADFNGDGKLDLVTANYADNAVSVLLTTVKGNKISAGTLSGIVVAGAAVLALCVVCYVRKRFKLSATEDSSSQTAGSLTLRAKIEAYSPQAPDNPATLQAPIGIALSNSKIDLVSLSESKTEFDYFNTGNKTKTSWIGPKDAFLVYDHNANQEVDSANELVLTKWSSTATTDFIALKEVFDSNKDNKFNAHDAEFKNFLVWQDKNQDGISQSNEIKSLQEAGLTQIDFNTEQTIKVRDWFPAFAGTSFGKQQEMRIAGAYWADGSKTLAYDIALEAESLA